MASEKFVRCIDDGGDSVSLTVGELYETLPLSAVATSRGLLRVINNLGEAQDYPTYLFASIQDGFVVNQDRAAELLALYREGRLTPEEHTQLIEYATQTGATDNSQTEAVAALARKLNVPVATLVS